MCLARWLHESGAAGAGWRAGRKTHASFVGFVCVPQPSSQPERRAHTSGLPGPSLEATCSYDRDFYACGVDEVGGIELRELDGQRCTRRIRPAEDAGPLAGSRRGREGASLSRVYDGEEWEDWSNGVLVLC